MNNLSEIQNAAIDSRNSMRMRKRFPAVNRTPKPIPAALCAICSD